VANKKKFEDPFSLSIRLERGSVETLDSIASSSDETRQDLIKDAVDVFLDPEYWTVKMCAEVLKYTTKVLTDEFINEAIKEKLERAGR